MESDVLLMNHNVEACTSSINLVPGDLIKLKSNEKLTCDCILLQGRITINLLSTKEHA
jgi:magnesium-transporting ATPase (P-type)